MVVGAVIGYITNYLAIRMLFRPSTPKYLFGKKLPFTPGVIPKERDRLARQTGQTVKEYLLTEEAVLSHVHQAQVPQRIQAGVVRAVEKWSLEGITVGQALQKIHGPNAPRISHWVSKLLIEKHFFGWADEETAIQRVQKLLAVIPQYTKEQAFQGIQKEVTHKMVGFVQKEGRAEQIVGWINQSIERQENKTLEEVLPEHVLVALLSTYNHHEEQFVTWAKKALKSTQAMAAIREAVTVTVDKHLSGPLRFVLRPEALAARTVSALESYLASPESDELLAQNLRQLVERLLSMPVQEVFQQIPQESFQNRIQELLNGAAVWLEKRTVEEKFLVFLQENQNKIESEISQGIGYAISNTVKNTTERSLTNFLTPKVESLMGIPLAGFFQGRTEEVGLKARKTVESALPKTVHFLVDKFEVDQLVENQIKQFDILMLERIILDVAQKELQAITNLGALLGAIMGFVQPLLQMFL